MILSDIYIQVNCNFMKYENEKYYGEKKEFAIREFIKHVVPKQFV